LARREGFASRLRFLRSQAELGRELPIQVRSV